MLGLLIIWFIVVYLFGHFTLIDNYYLGVREKILRFLFLPISLPAFVVSFLLSKLAYFLFFEFENNKI